MQGLNGPGSPQRRTRETKSMSRAGNQAVAKWIQLRNPARKQQSSFVGGGGCARIACATTPVNAYISRYLGVGGEPPPPFSCIIRLGLWSEAVDPAVPGHLGVTWPPTEGAEVGDDGEDCRRRVTVCGCRASPRRLHWCTDARNPGKTATSRHLWGRSACLPHGTARSASLLAFSISALRSLRRGDQETSWRREPETAISTSADCSRSPLAHHRTRPARVGERASADSKASSRMPVSRCDCYPPTLVFEPCLRNVSGRDHGREKPPAGCQLHRRLR